MMPKPIDGMTFERVIDNIDRYGLDSPAGRLSRERLLSCWNIAANVLELQEVAEDMAVLCTSLAETCAALGEDGEADDARDA